MRPLITFVLGFIVGGAVVLYLPDGRRIQLQREVREQIISLEAEMKKLGGQLKSVNLPKVRNDDVSPTPTP
ncbi:MAG TPA: hypothetical protein VGD78_02445 [Chthoniobacterales bacterium]